MNKNLEPAKKRLRAIMVVIISLAAATASASDLLIGFDLNAPYFNASPSSNRVVTLQPTVPFIGNTLWFTSDVAGTFTFMNRNAIPQTYIGQVRAKNSAGSIDFQIDVATEDIAAGTNFASNMTSVGNIQTYPTSGKSAYSISASESRFVRKGTAVNTNVVLRPSEGVTIGTNILGSDYTPALDFNIVAKVSTVSNLVLNATNAATTHFMATMNASSNALWLAKVESTNGIDGAAYKPVSFFQRSSITLSNLTATGAITNVVAGSNTTVQVSNGIATVNATVSAASGSNSVSSGNSLVTVSTNGGNYVVAGVSQTNGILTALQVTNTAAGQAQAATNALGSAAYQSKNAFQPASANLTNWSGTTLFNTNGLANTNYVNVATNAENASMIAYSMTLSNSVYQNALARIAAATNTSLATENAFTLTIGGLGTNNTSAGLARLTNAVINASNSVFTALVAATNESLAAANTFSLTIGGYGTNYTAAGLARLTNAVMNTSNSTYSTSLAQIVAATNANLISASAYALTLASFGSNNVTAQITGLTNRFAQTNDARKLTFSNQANALSGSLTGGNVSFTNLLANTNLLFALSTNIVTVFGGGDDTVAGLYFQQGGNEGYWTNQNLLGDYLFYIGPGYTLYNTNGSPRYSFTTLAGSVGTINNGAAPAPTVTYGDIGYGNSIWWSGTFNSTNLDAKLNTLSNQVIQIAITLTNGGGISAATGTNIASFYAGMSSNYTAQVSNLLFGFINTAGSTNSYIGAGGGIKVTTNLAGSVYTVFMDTNAVVANSGSNTLSIRIGAATNVLAQYVRDATNGITGGSGISSDTATNIAAYQALLATNGIAAGSGISAATATNIFQNGQVGGVVSGPFSNEVFSASGTNAIMTSSTNAGIVYIRSNGGGGTNNSLYSTTLNNVVGVTNTGNLCFIVSNLDILFPTFCSTYAAYTINNPFASGDAGMCSTAPFTSYTCATNPIWFGRQSAGGTIGAAAWCNGSSSGTLTVGLHYNSQTGGGGGTANMNLFHNGVFLLGFTNTSSSGGDTFDHVYTFSNESGESVFTVAANTSNGNYILRLTNSFVANSNLYNGVAIGTNSAGTNALEVFGNVDSTVGYTVNGRPISSIGSPIDLGLLYIQTTNLFVTNASGAMVAYNGIYQKQGASSYLSGSGWFSNTTASSFLTIYGYNVSNSPTSFTTYNNYILTTNLASPLTGEYYYLDHAFGYYIPKSGALVTNQPLVQYQNVLTSLTNDLPYMAAGTNIVIYNVGGTNYVAATVIAGGGGGAISTNIITSADSRASVANNSGGTNFTITVFSQTNGFGSIVSHAATELVTTNQFATTNQLNASVASVVTNNTSGTTLGGAFTGTFNGNIAGGTNAAEVSRGSTIPTSSQFTNTQGAIPVKDWYRTQVNPLTMQSPLIRKPPMGMDAFTLPGGTANSTEAIQKPYADIAKFWGLTGRGWRLINIDSGWQATNRGAGGTVTWDTNKWPDGMSDFAAYCHARGCLAGIYCEIGTPTDSAGFNASTNVEADMINIVNWGFDYIQIDKPGQDGSQQYDDNLTALRMRAVAAIQQCSATNGQGRAVMVRGHGVARGNQYESLALNVTYQSGSAANLDWNAAFTDLPTLWTNLWPHWRDSTSYPASVSKGHFHYNMDPIPNLIGFGVNPQQTVLNMYAIGTLPMLFNAFGSPTNIATTFAIQTNMDFIDINQDDLVIQGQMVVGLSNSVSEVWTKPLANGDTAVCLFNRSSNATATVGFNLNDIGINARGTVYLYDVWNKTNASVTDTYTNNLAAYESKLFRVIPASRFLLSTSTGVTNGQTGVSLNGNPPPVSNVASGSNSFTMGQGTTASGAGSISGGVGSSATGDESTALGHNVNVSGLEAFGAAANATVSGTGGIGLNANGQVLGTYGMAFGPKANELAGYGFAAGYKAVANAHDAVIFSSTAFGSDTFKTNSTAGSFEVDSYGGINLWGSVISGNAALLTNNVRTLAIAVNTNYTIGASDLGGMASSNLTYFVNMPGTTSVFTFPAIPSSGNVSFTIINTGTNSIILTNTGTSTFKVASGYSSQYSNSITLNGYFDKGQTWENLNTTNWIMTSHSRTTQDIQDIAGAFTTITNGNGSQLTNLNAANISSGTIAATRLPIATTNAVGAIKVDGTTTSIDANGVLSIISTLTYKQSCTWATAAALPSSVYNNGSSGVGATITGLSLGALTVDGNSVAVNDRILVKDQVNAGTNGIYTVTIAGSAGAVFILTRSTDFDQSSDIAEGDAIFIEQGSANTNTSWVQTIAGTVTVGTTPLNFVQTAGPITLTGAVTANGIGSIATTYAGAFPVVLLPVIPASKLTNDVALLSANNNFTGSNTTNTGNLYITGNSGGTAGAMMLVVTASGKVDTNAIPAGTGTKTLFPLSDGFSGTAFTAGTPNYFNGFVGVGTTESARSEAIGSSTLVRTNIWVRGFNGNSGVFYLVRITNGVSTGFSIQFTGTGSTMSASNLTGSCVEPAGGNASWMATNSTSVTFPVFVKSQAYYQ